MAEQLELFSVLSPCIGVCKMDTRGYCLGCFRSREERFKWGRSTDSEKRNIIRLASNRRLRVDRRTNEVPEKGPMQPDLF